MESPSSLRRVVTRGLLALLALLVVALAVLKLKHGGGQPYPDLSTAPKVPESGLEVLATLDYPPGCVAVSPDGRVFFDYHPFVKAERFGQPTVFELVDGKPRPYPDAAFQARYQGVFGMTVDRQNRLWFIQPGGLDFPQTKLMAFDLKTNQPVFEHAFPAKVAPFAQDLRVTPDGSTVLLADTGLFKFTDPGLVVFDLASKSHRTLLAKHPSARPQDWVMRTPYGPHRLGYGLVTFAVGIDGIEISSDGQWLYYATMTHDGLYRVPLAAVRDAALDEAALAARIELVGKKPMSDGITIDREGRVLITDVEHGGIARMTTDGKLETLVKSPKVIWADGIVQAPDGRILFTDSAIPAYIHQLALPPAQEKFRAAAPFRLYGVRAP